MIVELKKQWLKKTWDFQKIITEKQKVHNKNFVVFYKKNFKQPDSYKFGISIPQKIVKKVVLRNKYKRQIKYILFKLQHEKKLKQWTNLKGYDFLIIIKKEFTTEDFQTKKKNLENLFNFFIWKISSKNLVLT